MLFRGLSSSAPKGIWDQRSFDIFEAVLPEERRDADNRRLAEIFNYAAKVPVAAQALEWAQAHDVRFFIDHKSKGTNAVYRQGMGIVSLSLYALEQPDATPPVVINRLTHEISHMWQDYEGWLAYDKKIGFSHLCMTTNVTEAAASAFGGLAQAQAQNSDRYRTADEANNFLAAAFSGWFATRLPQVYGGRAARVTGQLYGLAKMNPFDNDTEISAIRPRLRPPVHPLNFSDEIETLRMIGKTFDGGNFLKGHEDETAVRNIFDRDLALRFHDSARQKPDDLVLAICQHEEQQALRRQRAGLRY